MLRLIAAASSQTLSPILSIALAAEKSTCFSRTFCSSGTVLSFTSSSAQTDGRRRRDDSRSDAYHGGGRRKPGRRRFLGLTEGSDVTKDEVTTPLGAARHLMGLTLKAELAETAELCQGEMQVEKRTMDKVEMECRGLALHDLQLDRGYWRHIDGGLGEFEIKLDIAPETSRSLSDFGAARGFRLGKLVKVVKCDKGEDGMCRYKDFILGNDLDSWRSINGVVSGVLERSVLVRINSISNFILDDLLKKGDGSISLLKRPQSEMRNQALGYLTKLSKDYLKDEGSFSKAGGAFSAALKELYALPTEAACDVVSSVPPHDVTIFHDDLDQSKIAALMKCAQRQLITILHGPPGTGKTTALAAAVLSAVTQGERVLVTAPSHAACDAFLLALIRYWPVDRLDDPSNGAVVRLGRELRFSVPAVRHFMPLKSGLRKSTDDAVGIAENKLVKLRDELLNEKLPAKNRGGALLEEAQLVRGLAEKANALITAAIVASKVTVCTSHQAGRLMAWENVPLAFDLVCLDEAGFARMSDVMPLIMKAPRLILSGDHRQLPPVVLSQKAMALGLDVSLLERLATEKSSNVCLLTTQFRSHSLISGWSSQYFYSNRVQAHPSVGDGLLTDLPGVASTAHTQQPLLFIDTQGMGCTEQRDPFDPNSDSDDASIANLDEATIVEQIVTKFLALGVPPSQMGVITPYWAQVSLLRELIWNLPGDGKAGGKAVGHGRRHGKQLIEIRTVDGYQGREKEFVVLSLVRSNAEGAVGFLRDTRRLNVSVTRARKCCIVVGDVATLGKDPGVASFIDYCSRNNVVVPVEKYFQELQINITKSKAAVADSQ